MDGVLRWSGAVTDVIPFAGQDLTIGYSTRPEDPLKTVTIKGTGSPVLNLPNSTASAPTWSDIPGTNPVLQARQDGHVPPTDILIRHKDDATATLAVTYTSPAAAATLISDGATTGAPYTLASTYYPALNRVFLDGAVVNSGGSPIAGGTVLFTIAAAHAPAARVQFTERTSTTLSPRVTIFPDGTLRLDQPLAAGATCSFDGLNYRKR